jgi:hypothetical protein
VIGAPTAVVRAFGLEGEPTVLTGGMAPVYRYGDVVLKETRHVEEDTYIAEVMAAVEVDEARVRVARPVAADGQWVVGGWTGWRVVAGEHRRGGAPWASALDAAHALHEALRDVPRAEVLDRRTHRWAIADRAAWGEIEPELAPEVQAQCDRLWPLVPPAVGEPQLIHSDLCGNLLFDAVLPPAVIDFSPAWQVPGFAAAIYVVDALGWHSGDDDLVALALADEGTAACLARAGIFRLVALDGLVRDLDQELGSLLPEYEALVDRLALALA